MASAFTYKLNIAEVHSNIKEATVDVIKTIEGELTVFANGTVNDAKRFAPVDEGVLRNNIAFVKESLKISITVNVPYAAYIEFGTKKFAAAYVSGLPADWKTFAAQFKGKAGSGSVDEFVLLIMEWVKRKGIAGTYSVKTKKRTGNKGGHSFEDADAAYSIALYILRNGIHAHPYLYPAFKKNKDLFIANLKKQLSG